MQTVTAITFISYHHIIRKVYKDKYTKISLPDTLRAKEVSDPIKVPEGPVTRSRAKRFKESLNGFIREVWEQEASRKPMERAKEGEPSWKVLISAQGTCDKLEFDAMLESFQHDMSRTIKTEMGILRERVGAISHSRVHGGCRDGRGNMENRLRRKNMKVLSDSYSWKSDWSTLESHLTSFVGAKEVEHRSATEAGKMEAVEEVISNVPILVADEASIDEIPIVSICQGVKEIKDIVGESRPNMDELGTIELEMPVLEEPNPEEPDLINCKMEFPAVEESTLEESMVDEQLFANLEIPDLGDDKGKILQSYAATDVETKKKAQRSCFATASDLKWAVQNEKPIYLMVRRDLLQTNKLDKSLPSGKEQRREPKRCTRKEELGAPRPRIMRTKRPPRPRESRARARVLSAKNPAGTRIPDFRGHAASRERASCPVPPDRCHCALISRPFLVWQQVTSIISFFLYLLA
ncbi:hypothetical protein C2S52_001219 [Perilla frutescens var. hirtella]|nr:hypothetical protein C2S52_001219 [Perilla frutescens var. hirtella]